MKQQNRSTKRFLENIHLSKVIEVSIRAEASHVVLGCWPLGEVIEIPIWASPAPRVLVEPLHFASTCCVDIFIINKCITIFLQITYNTETISLSQNHFPWRKVIYLNVYLQRFHVGMFHWWPRRLCSHSAQEQGGFPSAISTSTCRYEANPGHVAIFRFSLIMFSSWDPRQREDLFIPWGKLPENWQDSFVELQLFLHSSLGGSLSNVSLRMRMSV